MAEIMDNELLHILQHSLGVDQFGQGRQFRNHFVAGEKDVDRCRELAFLGLMVERDPNGLTDGAPWFSVTQKGIDAVALESPKPPPLTRSQRRYQEYLDTDCCESFGRWLKHQGPQARRAC